MGSRAPPKELDEATRRKTTAKVASDAQQAYYRRR
jgi:hypothetical protein